MDRSQFLVFALGAFLWGFTYYYIRRALNPEVTDLSKYKADAVYGSIANLASRILFSMLQPLVLGVAA